MLWRQSWKARRLLVRLPLDEQLDGLRSVLSQNATLSDVVARAATLELPGRYMTAGCLFQTVWTVVTGRTTTDGIKDYHVFYFDSSDMNTGRASRHSALAWAPSVGPAERPIRRYLARRGMGPDSPSPTVRTELRRHRRDGHAPAHPDGGTSTHRRGGERGCR